MKTPMSLFLSMLLVPQTSLIAGVQQLQHDDAGRLTAAAFAGGQSINYTYDSAGNLTQRQFSVGGSADSDGDGMEDAWEQLHFGNLSRDGSGDFDNDGFRDLHEFVAGTIPNDPGSALQLLRELNVNGGVTVQWHSVAGRTYLLQYKNSLNDAAWTDLPGNVTATAAISSRADNPPPNQNTRFYRVILVP